MRAAARATLRAKSAGLLSLTRGLHYLPGRHKGQSQAARHQRGRVEGVAELKLKIFDSLPFGRENAVPSEVLADALGFSSVRELQHAVQKEREAGAVILSTTSDGGGYFRSNDPEELHRFVRTLNSRARNTLRAAESAQRVLEAATGQMRLEEV